MDLTIDARMRQLRGGLPMEAPGARGLERFARNPQCALLGTLTLAGVTPQVIAHRVYGEPVRDGQSPFAIKLGNDFEQRLFDADARRLFELYRAAGRLTPADHRVIDLAALYPDTPGMKPAPRRAALAQRQRHTLELLRQKADTCADAPNLIIKPFLTIELPGLRCGIEPDALVAAASDAFYRPVEIKSYPDRRGKTDPADLKDACRQAAVGLEALHQALQALSVTAADALTPPLADLVLRKPGSFVATLHPMPIKREVWSLRLALARAPRLLALIEQQLPPGSTLAAVADLERLPCHYVPACKEHCALADCCRGRARQAGDLGLLGEDARESLAAAGDLHRAMELLDGAGPPPRNPAEAELAQQLAGMLALWRQETPG